jgi:NAD(P)-dependent dehydrogenase (short-subunit alcohol dehydrogenase family)
MTPTSNTLFLVTGGGRGITASCVIALATRYHCKFALLGRSNISLPEPTWANGITDSAELQARCIADLKAQGEKPLPKTIQKIMGQISAKREIEHTIAEVEKAGGHAQYYSADITHNARMGEAIAQIQADMGHITAFLHGAGNLADKRIENKTPDDFEFVYGTKIDGLLNVLAHLPPAQLTHIVFFSSAAGFYGNAGQSDYAIANEILNRMAHTLKHTYPNAQVVSLNWGPWEAGMVDDSLKALFAERHIQVIPVDVGAKMLIRSLDNPNTPVQVLVGSPMHHAPITNTDDTLQKFSLHRHLTLEQNPFLNHHVIGKHAVLPMVHALAWMINACEDMATGYTFYKAEDYNVLKGVVFDEGLATSYTLDLTETAKSADGVTFACKVHSLTPQGKPRYHYSATIHLLRDLPTPPMYAGLDLSAKNPLDGKSLYTDGTLFHGESFQGVEQVLSVSEQKLVMQCRSGRIAEQTQGQFPIQTFNPFTADIAFQAMVIWARKIYGSASLPLSAGGGEQYRILPPNTVFYVTLEVLEHHPAGLVANIITHDEAGVMYSEVFGAEVTISAELNKLFKA